MTCMCLKLEEISRSFTERLGVYVCRLFNYHTVTNSVWEWGLKNNRSSIFIIFITILTVSRYIYWFYWDQVKCMSVLRMKIWLWYKSHLTRETRKHYESCHRCPCGVVWASPIHLHIFLRLRFTSHCVMEGITLIGSAFRWLFRLVWFAYAQDN